MPDLAALQGRMATAILSGRLDGFDGCIRPGRIAPAEALGLHRNTVLYGLVNTLRLTFPTVDALVGEAFFDQAALAFVAVRPPAQGRLTDYGADFPAFLQTYPPAVDLPYLADVARLDAAVEDVGARSVGMDGEVVDLGRATLTLDASLSVLSLTRPAAAIRDAIEADDDAALAAIDPAPGRYAHGLWRRPQGAAIRPLSPVAAAFLHAVLARHPPDAALQAALAESQDLSPLQSEIFAAPFARLTLNPSLEADR
jgi:hypothetical protein